MGTPPTPEELKLLSNVELRRKDLPEARLKIKNRIFESDVRFKTYEWENTDFENCDFLGCTMFNGVIKNINFSNCLFFATRWEDRDWEDVSFKDCAWRGPFNMGAPNGERALRFNDCEFIGATQEELGYGGKSEYFGSIGGTNGNVLYQRCNFERTFINGGVATRFFDCKMRDVVLDGQDGSAMLLDSVTASELVDFGSGMGVFSRVVIKKSSFAQLLTFKSAKIDTALFEDTKAYLDLTGVKANSIELRRVTFWGAEKPNPDFQYGLISTSAKVAVLTIDNCTFQGHDASLFLSGVEDRATANGKLLKDHINLYSTDIGSLSIRHTPIKYGHFKYMEIGTLLLESLSIGDADFSNGRIRKFVTRNVTLTGKLKFENTAIVEKDTDLGAHLKSDTDPQNT